MKKGILRKLYKDIITNSNRCHLLPVANMILMLCFFHACSKIPERNKIVFRDSVSVVQDSVRAMSYLITKMREKEVKNYFFTNDDSLVINNRKIGRMPDGDSIDFIKDIFY